MPTSTPPPWSTDGDLAASAVAASRCATSTSEYPASTVDGPTSPSSVPLGYRLSGINDRGAHRGEGGHPRRHGLILGDRRGCLIGGERHAVREEVLRHEYDEPARGDCGLSHSRFLAGVPATRQRYVPSAFIPPGRVGLVGHAIREQVVGHRFLHKCLSRHHVDLLPLRFSRDRVYRHPRGPKGGGPDR